MYFQNDPAAPEDFQHYACLFSSLAFSREKLLGRAWSLKEATLAWQGARDAGIISGDLNKDGDYDDDGEDEIQSFARLIALLKLPLRVVPPGALGLETVLDRKGIRRIAPLSRPLDPERYWAVEAWRWKITHYVVGDGTGHKPVIYDPIANGSLTVRNGRCESLRLFEIVEARV